ncbi:sugar ABC transporter permease [Alicyclobacillus sp. TC]|nr:sugar ABC transporter permease [Alicyclobacillus sp. TC]
MSLVRSTGREKKHRFQFPYRWKRELTGWLFVLPTTFFVSLFGVGAILYVLYLSFLQWNLIDPVKKWVGFHNYQLILQDSSFWQSVFRTLLYLIGTTGITVPFALFIAVCMNKTFHGVRLFRTIFFMPYVVPTVASAVVWFRFFSSSDGLMNAIFRLFGLPPQGWLSNYHEALWVIVLLYVWQFTGYFAILFLHGLQNVPDSLYEAAAVDGSTPFLTFWKITLPMISPTTFFVVTVSFIFSFLSFDQIYVLTEGGPADSTTTLVYDLFEQGFEFFHIGIASAMSIFLFLFLLGLTYLQFRGESKWVHHQM